MIETLNLTLDTVEYVLILKVKYQIIRYIKHLTPEIRGQVFNVIPIPPKTGGMGMKRISLH